MANGRVHNGRLLEVTKLVNKGNILSLRVGYQRAGMASLLVRYTLPYQKLKSSLVSRLGLVTTPVIALTTGLHLCISPIYGSFPLEILV